MNLELSVDSGEVKAQCGAGFLRAVAIGTCVVVTAFDRETLVGGDFRRSCSLDVASGQVTCTVGDSGSRLLWKPGGV